MARTYSDETPDERDPWQRLLHEIYEQARKADRVDRARLEYLESLVKHPGFGVLQELIGVRIQLLGDEVMRPAGGVDRAMGLEYVKGAMSGLIIARDLVSVTITTLRETLPKGAESEGSE